MQKLRINHFPTFCFITVSIRNAVSCVAAGLSTGLKRATGAGPSSLGGNWVASFPWPYGPRLPKVTALWAEMFRMILMWMGRRGKTNVVSGAKWPQRHSRWAWEREGWPGAEL